MHVLSTPQAVTLLEPYLPQIGSGSLLDIGAGELLSIIITVVVEMMTLFPRMIDFDSITMICTANQPV